MISSEKKLIFVHMPKTGGSSVAVTLNPYLDCICSIYQNDEDREMDIIRTVGITTSRHKHHLGINYKHATANELKSIYGEEVFKEFHKFIIVRHPYDRLLSLQFWRFGRLDNLDEFKQELKQKDIETNRHFGLIDYYTCDENGNQLVDRVIKFDNLSEEFSQLCDEYDITNKLVHVNRTSHEHYSDYYDRETYDLINEIYKKEIDMYWDGRRE